jgi:XTP/dITP diphosphohydrolase
VKLLIATTNPGKLGEFREILGPILLGGAGPHELISLADLKLPAPDEDGETFEANAALKARASALASGLWTLADDSGICVDALGGAPGVRSARYADSDEARRGKLLQALADVPVTRRGAHFFCAAALSSPDGKRLFRAEGQVIGTVATAARGKSGFGYDPIFVPTEVPAQTLAEVPQAEKNRLSHRGRALARLAPLLKRLLHDGDLK